MRAAIADAPDRRRRDDRRGPRASSGGWRCSTPSRADAIDDRVRRARRHERARRRRSTTWSRRRSVRSRAPTSPSSSRAFAAWDPPGRIDGERRFTRAGSPRLAPPPPARCWWSAARRRSHGRVTVPIGGRGGARGARDRSRRRLARGPRARAARRPPRASIPPRGNAAVALGRRAVAHQIAGASRAMLDLARTHALERVQFGRPIARFQAVRHRLADALVAVEALEATLDARPGRSRAPTRRRSRRPSPDARRARWPRTASRCSPASASPRSIRSTASSSGRWRSKGSSDRPTRSSSTSDGGCSPRAAFRRSSSCDVQERP